MGNTDAPHGDVTTALEQAILDNDSKGALAENMDWLLGRSDQGGAGVAFHFWEPVLWSMDDAAVHADHEALLRAYRYQVWTGRGYALCQWLGHAYEKQAGPMVALLRRVPGPVPGGEVTAADVARKALEYPYQFGGDEALCAELAPWLLPDHGEALMAHLESGQETDARIINRLCLLLLEDHDAWADRLLDYFEKTHRYHLTCNRALLALQDRERVGQILIGFVDTWLASGLSDMPKKLAPLHGQLMAWLREGEQDHGLLDNAKAFCRKATTSWGSPGFWRYFIHELSPDMGAPLYARVLYAGVLLDTYTTLDQLTDDDLKRLQLPPEITADRACQTLHQAEYRKDTEAAVEAKEKLAALARQDFDAALAGLELATLDGQLAAMPVIWEVDPQGGLRPHAGPG